MPAYGASRSLTALRPGDEVQVHNHVYIKHVHSSARDGRTPRQLAYTFASKHEQAVQASILRGAAED